MGAAKRVATWTQDRDELIPAGISRAFTVGYMPDVPMNTFQREIPAPPPSTSDPEPSNKPAVKPVTIAMEAVEDDGDEPPTLLACTKGWYRRGETFYEVGRGPFPTFGQVVEVIEVEPEPAMVAVPAGPAKQGFLF